MQQNSYLQDYGKLFLAMGPYPNIKGKVIKRRWVHICAPRQPNTRAAKCAIGFLRRSPGPNRAQCAN